MEKSLSSSETIRGDSNINKNSWLAGILDSDGCIYFYKNRNTIEINVTVELRDIGILYEIKKQVKGGKIIKHGENAVRWRIHKKVLIESFVNMVNGHVRIRAGKLKECCNRLGIDFIPASAESISLNDSYFAGLVDGDGSIGYNEQSNHYTLTVTSKFPITFLNSLGIGKVYGPYTYLDKRTNKFYTRYDYKIQSLLEFNKIYHYFRLHRCFSAHKFNLIMSFKGFCKIRDNMKSKNINKKNKVLAYLVRAGFTNVQQLR